MNPKDFDRIVDSIPEETRLLHLTTGLVVNRISYLKKKHSINEIDFLRAIGRVEMTFACIAKLEVYFGEKILEIKEESAEQITARKVNE